LAKKPQIRVEARVGYMCEIDFDHELGAASDGSRVFPSVADLVREHACADCGIVKVEVRLMRIIRKGTSK
jgi:hypothetical protein